MLAGAFVLHRTLPGTSNGEDLTVWSIALAGTWVAGWATLSLIARAAPRLPAAASRSRRKRHPLLLTLGIAVGFALASLAGALVLRYLTPLGDDVIGVTSRVNEAPAVIILVALVTGASEELFFRLGLWQIIPRRWFPLISTLVYGIVTLATGNLPLTLAAVLLGLTCSLTLTVTGRWYAPLIIHACWTLALVGLFPLL